MGKRTGQQGGPMTNHTRKKMDHEGFGAVNDSGERTSDLGLHERVLAASTEKYHAR
jgi:hypothetical protein